MAAPFKEGSRYFIDFLTGSDHVSNEIASVADYRILFRLGSSSLTNGWNYASHTCITNNLLEVWGGDFDHRFR